MNAIIYITWIVFCAESAFSNDYETSAIFCSTKDEVPNRLSYGSLSKNVVVIKPWSKGRIPYEISDQFNKTSIDLIENAMNDFHNVTCVRFVPRTTETNFVLIMWDLKCQSTIGESEDGGQHNTYLSPACLNKFGVLHQLAHVIGLKHEHNRIDRDNYISVMWDNINEEYWAIFVKHSTENLRYWSDLPYDYNSVIHFESTMGSKNGNPTIIAKQRQIGRKSAGLSSIDILKINKMYKCSWQLMGRSSRRISEKSHTNQSLTQNQFHSQYKINCDQNLRWKSKRALENEKNSLSRASQVMQDYMKYWYGGHWSVIYHNLPLNNGWSITDHKGDNYCHIKIKDNVDLGMIVFEENTRINRKHLMNCDFWSGIFERKYLDNNKNITKTVEDFYYEFKESFRQNSSFTIFCDGSRFLSTQSSSDFCNYGLKNGIQCIWYQH